MNRKEKIEKYRPKIGYHSSANWDKKNDEYTQLFYQQNLSQFWRPEDISMQPDLNVWNVLPDNIKEAYNKNLMTLTALDTWQGDIGIPVVSRSLNEEDHQRKAVLNFMAAMENAVHAKSYSNIFMTYINSHEIDELFEWSNQNKHLQAYLDIILSYYRDLDKMTYDRNYKFEKVDKLEFQITQYKAIVASVFLETYLFYSGFYYPLYFYGQGKLMQAGEIINLILRDESIHGVFVGIIGQELYDGFSEKLQKELYEWTIDLLNQLYNEQMELVEEIYDPVELSHDVKIFCRYNANKALMNLGFDPYFEWEEVNPVVLNGLNTETKTMDNFSMKGNGYQKMVTESIKNEDFNFDTPKIN